MWQYLNRPTHAAFHDLTTVRKPPPNLRSLLGLGLKFIPTPRTTNSYRHIQQSTFERFRRALHLKVHFAGSDGPGGNYNPKLYVATSWTPPPWTLPKEVTDRFQNFASHLKKQFRPRPCRSNLLPHQREALDLLQKQGDFLIVPCDKNLGPSIIERDKYIAMAMRDHFHDTTTYRRLTPQSIRNCEHTIRTHFKHWLETHKRDLPRSEKTFLRYHFRENEQPFARFYLTLKVHKFTNGRPLKSRPIVSCPGSLLHPLGLWVDSHLQKVAKGMPSYFKSSFDLKQELTGLDIPPYSARLFTADAVSMYTSIPTNPALNSIAAYLRNNMQRYHHELPIEAVIEALRLVMKNNIFTFGDMTFKQLNGTAMGTPPAPPFATIYYGIHEATFLNNYPGRLLFYRRFIDDVFGIWIIHPDPDTDAQLWQQFQAEMNTAPGLTWEFSERTSQVDFMDLTVTLHHGRITTSLYEKPLNLHLYIPPHSSHPPGLLPGIVHGTLFRIYTLCTDDNDKVLRTKAFFHRLRARGYQPNKLMPLFNDAITRAQAYTGPINSDRDLSTSIILHLQYHPQDPPSTAIQRAWRTYIESPRHKPRKIWDIKQPKTQKKCNIRRMIIAYSRSMNLGNLLTHRNLDNEHQPGPSVSSYYHPE